jgi:hypothetical protein
VLVSRYKSGSSILSYDSYINLFSNDIRLWQKILVIYMKIEKNGSFKNFWSFLQWNSRTFLACRTESKQILWVRFDRTELCFIAFESFNMMHLSDFYELEKTSKYWKNSIRFDWIRFSSIFQESSRVSLYCFSLNHLKKNFNIKNKINLFSKNNNKIQWTISFVLII